MPEPEGNTILIPLGWNITIFCWNLTVVSHLLGWLLIITLPRKGCVGGGVENLETFYTVGGIIKWCNYCLKQYVSSSKN